MESNSAVDDQLTNDLQQLSMFEPESLRKLVNMIVAFLLDPAHTDFQSILGAFAEQQAGISMGKLKILVRGLIVFLYGGMKDGWSVAELKANCAGLSIEPAYIAVIAACWQERAGQMATALLSRTIKANELVDMDWSFGVTASTDDCDHVGKTFLQLKFTIDYGSEGLKDVYMELSLEQFFQFLAQMENCKQYLDFLNSA